MTVKRQPDRSDIERLTQVAIQYHSSARGEITARVGHRDTALFLFLAGATTLFSLSLTETMRQVLYVVPILGLGASQVYSQHTIVIGALGRYLGLELHEWVRCSYPHSQIPVQWDSSDSLLSMRGAGYLRPIFASGIGLIVLPQILALSVMLEHLSPSVIDIFGIVLDLVSIILTVTVLWNMHMTRKKYAAEIREYGRSWISDTGGRYAAAPTPPPSRPFQ
jgi:hypothetical protein